ncbi:hypothetical protein, partial [Chryseobacterium sp.]|uniref:hypothetical protein n=1 Tax=Chryseobacterium sp. TaxID=1871047 RepID=UPI0035B18FAE
VALVLPSRVTDVIRFAALWCPDFPTSRKTGNQQADFLAEAKVHKFCGKKANGKTPKDLGSMQTILIDQYFFRFFYLFTILQDNFH